MTYPKFFLKNQRPLSEVAPAPSKGHPSYPQLLVVADFQWVFSQPIPDPTEPRQFF
jgi:hypothetical protein